MNRVAGISVRLLLYYTNTNAITMLVLSNVFLLDLLENVKRIRFLKVNFTCLQSVLSFSRFVQRQNVKVLKLLFHQLIIPSLLNKLLQ